MYLEMATEEDMKMVESWKADADGILIFVRLHDLFLNLIPTRLSQTGLFSAAVASLISVSIQGLQQNPQDTSNFYLANIYQATINPNGPNNSSFPPSSPPPFSPPNNAVWVNALWFLSLVISLTCALLATLLQQWARRYLKITQSRYTPHKRARIRAFFSKGVERCLLPWAVDALPTLLHISLFLFFAGLVVFLCNVNLTIFKLVISWVGLCMALYGCMTCMPIIRHDSPYYTPLSLPVWYIVTGISLLAFRALERLTLSRHFGYRTWDHIRNMVSHYGRSLVQGMQKTIEETALSSPSEIDTCAFMWTFDCLDEDHELEHFFAGLPCFRDSKVVDDPLPRLTEEEKLKLSEGLRGLLDRTFSSNFLPKPVKNRRAIICEKAVDSKHMPNASILHAILFSYQHSGPVAKEIADVLTDWGNDMDEERIFHAQIAISRIIASRQPFDESWYILASNELGLPETSIRDYAAQGDSLSLLILIHLVRQQFTHFWKSSWDEYKFQSVLATASNFDIKNTLPRLQDEFCALWNQIVNKAQDGGDREMAPLILRPIRNVFLALHQDTDSAPTQFSGSTDDEDDILWFPFSYSVCKIPYHSYCSTPHIHDDGFSTTLAGPIPLSFPHEPNIPASFSSPTSPDPMTLSTYAPLRVDETVTDALPLDNQISQVIGQMTAEGRRISTPSPSPITDCATHGIIDPSKTTQPSTSSHSPKSNASASPPADIAVEQTELSCAPSGDLSILFSPSPAPVPDANPSTGLSLCLGHDSI